MLETLPSCTDNVAICTASNSQIVDLVPVVLQEGPGQQATHIVVGHCVKHSVRVLLSDAAVCSECHLKVPGDNQAKVRTQ